MVGDAALHGGPRTDARRPRGPRRRRARFFDPDGTPRGPEQRYDDPALAPPGLDFDSINLGIDFQLATQGSRIFGKGQAGNIQVAPIVFRIPEPGALSLGIAALVAMAAAPLRRRAVLPHQRADRARAEQHRTIVEAVGCLGRQLDARLGL